MTMAFNTLADKRKFLYRAFHPDGLDVCKRLGMTPSGDDGLIAEFRNTEAEITAMSPEARGVVLARVEWFSQAMEAAIQDLGDPTEGPEYHVSDWRKRDGRGDLMGLSIAMLLSGIELGRAQALKEMRKKHG